MNTVRLFFNGLKAVISGTDVNATGLDDVGFNRLYSLGKAQDLCHMVAAAFGGYATGELKAKFEKEKLLAVYRRESLDHEEERACAILAERNIDYMPLKGAVIKNYYPERWMRSASDVDILIRPQDVERALRLFDEAGYKYDGKSLHDHQLYSQSGVHIELHFALLGNDGAPLDNVWENAVANGCRYEMSNEYLMFYNLAHGAYHFADGGCGVKPFLDYWVLKSRLDIDEDRLALLIKNAGMEKFHAGFLRLAEVWFGNANHDSLTRQMEEYILKGGVYGTKANLGSAKAYRKGGKVKYFLGRIFKPRTELAAQYPNLEKRGWLMPYYQVKRWFNLLSKEKRANVKAEAAGSLEKNGIAVIFEELGI